MTDESTVSVFAYGSNMHRLRMQRRVPSAEPVGIGFVVGRTVKFHKRSIDGSAKADAPRTAAVADRIWGVVYDIHRNEKPDLDRHEFLGIGYDQERVTVKMSDGRLVQAWIYVARQHAIDQLVLPYSWYVEFIVQGAIQHRLPFCYIQDRLNVSGCGDPDTERHQTNTNILNQASFE